MLLSIVGILGIKGRRVKGKWETASEPLTTESKDSWEVVLKPLILLVFCCFFKLSPLS